MVDVRMGDATAVAYFRRGRGDGRRRRVTSPPLRGGRWEGDATTELPGVVCRLQSPPRRGRGGWSHTRLACGPGDNAVNPIDQVTHQLVFHAPWGRDHLGGQLDTLVPGEPQYRFLAEGLHHRAYLCSRR